MLDLSCICAETIRIAVESCGYVALPMYKVVVITLAITPHVGVCCSHLKWFNRIVRKTQLMLHLWKKAEHYKYFVCLNFAFVDLRLQIGRFASSKLIRNFLAPTYLFMQTNVIF